MKRISGERVTILVSDIYVAGSLFQSDGSLAPAWMLWHCHWCTTVVVVDVFRFQVRIRWHSLLPTLSPACIVSCLLTHVLWHAKFTDCVIVFVFVVVVYF